MGEVKVKGHNVSLTSYRLTSLWFHVNWPSYSWNTAFSKFDLENSRSRSQLKVTKKVYHPIDSYPFRSMSIGPPTPGIQLFQNLKLKIQGQGHGWGQSLKSQHGSNIQSTHIPFVPCQSGIQFLSYDFSKIWPWKSRVKVMGEVKVESHNMGPTFNRLTSLSFHVDQASHSWVTTFSKFDLENKGSKVMGWGHSSKSQWGSNILSTHIPFILCQTGIPFLSYDFFENLTLKIKGQGHGWGHSSKSQCGSNILSIHIPFVPCELALPFLRYSIFKIWPWKSRVKVKWPWCCTTTGLDNSIELRMAQIHPGVSEIWVPQSQAQVLPHLTSFWPMGKPIWGKWANNYDSAQLQVQTSPWNFKWDQSIVRFQRYAFRKVWTQFVPNFTSFWPMGKPIWGKWANDHDSAQLQA